MILVRTMLTGVMMLGATAAAAAADHCLTRNEQKAKTAAHGVVPLSRAMGSVKQHGEVIQARLCEHGGGADKGDPSAVDPQPGNLAESQSQVRQTEDRRNQGDCGRGCGHAR